MTRLSLRFRPSLRVSVTCIQENQLFDLSQSGDASARLVRVRGLEPPRLAATEPKSVASTSFATPATALRPGCVHLSDVPRDVKGRVPPRGRPEPSGRTAHSFGIRPTTDLGGGRGGGRGARAGGAARRGRRGRRGGGGARAGGAPARE